MMPSPYFRPRATSRQGDRCVGRAFAIHPQSGAASAALLALTALAGFAAGALTVAWVAPERAVLSAPDSATMSVRYRAPQPAARLPQAPPTGFPPPTVSDPNGWNFESAMAQPRGEPGRNRPDLLSGPEGWTYAP